MFRQLVTPGGTGPLTAAVLDNINSLFTYHPLQISALVETVWLNRNNAAAVNSGSPFLPWAPQFATNILNTPFFPGYDWTDPANPVPLPPGGGVGTFVLPGNQPGVQNTWTGTGPVTSQPTNWDHLIYAYLVENTGLFEIFSKILETYIVSEDLEIPSPASQLFWRNVEFLIFGDAMPSMVWTTSSRLRRDPVANRALTYNWIFGLDLSMGAELAAQHPYQKPAAANRDFIPTFEAFGREVWRGIENAKNTSGPNDTDRTVISTLAHRLFDMNATRLQSGNHVREAYMAVCVISFMQLAILYDSPAVVDLKAAASSPEERLKKLGDRVGRRAHPKSKPLFDLSGPFSVLMQSIETGAFNDPVGAQLLYTPGNAVSQNAEEVIDQYFLATGRDLKARTVNVAPRATTSTGALPKRQMMPPQSAGPRAGGNVVPVKQ